VTNAATLPERQGRGPTLTPPLFTGAPAQGAAMSLRSAPVATQSGVRPSPLDPAPLVVLQLSIGQRIVLSGKTVYTIGRASAEHPEPDVDLEHYYGPQAGISRQHVHIYIEDDGAFIEDLDSTNETIQNGYRLMAGQRYPLHNGDELRLGGSVLRVIFEQPPSR
jgi:pSer/pThr/pTyr-binding forkhead associated (FHA) protein